MQDNSPGNPLPLGRGGCQYEKSKKLRSDANKGILIGFPDADEVSIVKLSKGVTIPKLLKHEHGERTLLKLIDKVAEQDLEPGEHILNPNFPPSLSSVVEEVNEASTEKARQQRGGVKV